MKKIISIVIALSLMIGMSGCGGETPEQAVSNALNAVKTANKDEASKYFDYNTLVKNAENGTTLDAESEEMVKLFFRDLSYQVESSSVNGDEATVKTEITNTDMSLVLKNMIAQALPLAFSDISDEEMKDKTEQIFVDLLNSKDNKTVTNTVDIKLVKKDGQWKINFDEKFGDALLGGMLSLVNSMK